MLNNFQFVEEKLSGGMLGNHSDRPSSPGKQTKQPPPQPPVIVNSPPAFHLDKEKL